MVATALGYQKLAFGCFPKEGSVTLPVNLDFSTVASVVLDATIWQARGQFSQLQTLYIDNSANPNPLVIVMNVTFQRIVVKKNTCGYFPVMQPSPPSGIVFSTTPGLIIPIQVLNFFIPPAQWDSV